MSDGMQSEADQIVAALNACLARHSGDGQVQLAAILRATPEALTYLLQLPPGAYIDSAYAPHDAYGVLEFRIRGAGWPITDGMPLRNATAIVRQDYDESGNVLRRVIEWGLPNTGEPTGATCPKCMALILGHRRMPNEVERAVTAEREACKAVVRDVFDSYTPERVKNKRIMGTNSDLEDAGAALAIDEAVRAIDARSKPTSV